MLNYIFIFFQYALELFKSAQQLTGKTTFFQDHINRAQKALVESKKDNDFIYHERVPDAKSLPAIGKAPLAKTLPIPDRMGQSSKGIINRLAEKCLPNLHTDLQISLRLLFLSKFFKRWQLTV
jgi:BRO1-like domain